jgi:hypothetical protein
VILLSSDISWKNQRTVVVMLMLLIAVAHVIGLARYLPAQLAAL